MKEQLEQAKSAIDGMGKAFSIRPTLPVLDNWQTVEVPADELDRLIRLAEVGAGGFMEGPARNAAIVTVRYAESLWVTATGRAR